MGKNFDIDLLLLKCTGREDFRWIRRKNWALKWINRDHKVKKIFIFRKERWLLNQEQNSYNVTKMEMNINEISKTLNLP